MRSNSQTLNQLYIAASVLLAGLVAAACGGEDPQINSQSAALVEKAASDAVIKATKKHVMADLASLAQGASAASSWPKGTPAAGFSVDGAMAAASGVPSTASPRASMTRRCSSKSSAAWSAAR